MAITLDGTNGLTLPGTGTGVQLGSLTSGTAQSTTSGTAINFTEIPSWVKRITLMFQNISLSGTSRFLVQLGTGGVPTTTGYVSSSSSLGVSALATVTATTGFVLYVADSAAFSLYGSYTFMNLSSNIWVGSSTAAYGGVTGSVASAGFISLGGTLNTLRLTTVNGTDTFDAGSVNILYE